MSLSELSVALSLALFLVGIVNLLLILLLAFLSLIMKYIPIKSSIKDTIYYYIDEGGFFLMSWEFAIFIAFVIIGLIGGFTKWVGL